AKNKVERLSLGDSPGSPSSIPEDIKGRVVKPSDVEAIIYEDPVRLEGCVIYDTASWACKNNEGSTVVVNDGKKYVSHSSSAEEYKAYKSVTIPLSWAQYLRTYIDPTPTRRACQT